MQVGSVMSDIKEGDTVYCMQWVNEKGKNIGFSAYVYNIEGNKARIRIVKFIPSTTFSLAPPTTLIGQSFNNYKDIRMSYENVGNIFWIDTYALDKKLHKGRGEGDGAIFWTVVVIVIIISAFLQ